MSAHLHSLINYLHHYPHLAGGMTFLIAFIESLAIIGTVIPGSVTMTAIGALIGASVIPALSTFSWAIAGALCGDLLSYWAGYYYNERLRQMWPFRKYPEWLGAGETFFRKHGGKSVIIGRFAGPVRSAVPLIAGLLKMHPLRFISAAVPSACLWAFVYMTPGIMLGAVSLELPPASATKFIAYILLLLAAAWLAFWLVQLSIKMLYRQTDRLIARFWSFLQNQRGTRWLYILLHDPRYPNGHQQLGLALFALLYILLFVLLVWNIHSPAVLHFNHAVHALLSSLRNRPTDMVMLWMTILGDKHTLFIFAGFILIWFLTQRRWRAAIHWAGLTVVSAGLIEFFKRFIINIPRPEGLLNSPPGSSFPSGHTTLTLALLGFLAVLIAHELTLDKRKYMYVGLSVITGLVALSRVYLGGHWPIDVFAAILLGLFCMQIFLLSYRRKIPPAIAPKRLGLVAALSLLAALIIYGIPHYPQTRYDYTPYTPMQTTTFSIWWQTGYSQLPQYSKNHFGKSSEPLNIQWLGSLDTITELLTAEGWQAQPNKLTLTSTLTRLAPAPKNQPQLPLLSKLYNNRAPDLTMIKLRPQQPLLILRLWHADVELADTPQTLWIGSVGEYRITPKIYSPHHHNGKNLFVATLDELLPALEQQQYKIVAAPSIVLAEEPDNAHWNGKILLIRSTDQ